MGTIVVVPRTVGVEEEFLLFDATRPVLSDVGEQAAARADERSDGQFEHELKRQQAELGTEPHPDLGDLADELRRRRAELAAGASAHGARLVAVGTAPVESFPRTTPDGRYERMREAFGEIARAALSCGMHVHVEVASRDEGARALSGIRPWLPVILALSANSPYYDGRDTGYASYRSVLWQQWPTAGATGPFADAAEYDATVRALQATGAAMDEGMVYFDARLSAKYPTVEIRAADVCPYVADAATVAGLCRALVEAGAADALPGPGDAGGRVEVLRAATWRAARYGMTDTLWDPASARQAPAWEVVDALMTRLADTTDTGALRAGLADIRRRGTGSALQRTVHEESDDLAAVIDALAECTFA
jgi:glutamate---cysteine ligase / carboxylate-amine ligase